MTRSEGNGTMNSSPPPDPAGDVTVLVIEIPSGTPILEFHRLIRVKLLEYLGMDWVGEDFLLETQRVWSRQYGRRVDELEAIDILQNLRRLATVFARRGESGE